MPGKGTPIKTTLTGPKMTALTARDIQDIVSNSLKISNANQSKLSIEPFTGRNPRALSKWLRQWEIDADSANWDDTIKLRKFPSYLRDYSALWYDQNVKRRAVPPSTWQELKRLIKADLLSADHKSYLHGEIRNRKQAPNESVYNYILAMRDLCYELDNAMSDEDVLEHIYRGMNPEIAKLVRSHGPQTIDNFTDKAKAAERGIEVCEAFSNSAKINSESQIAVALQHFGENIGDAIKESFKEMTHDLKKLNLNKQNNVAFARNRPENRFNGRQNRRYSPYNSPRNQFRQENLAIGYRNDRSQSPDWRRNGSVSPGSNRRNNNENHSNNTNPKRVNFTLNSNLNQNRTTDGRNICFICQKVGHFARQCPERQNRAANSQNYVRQTNASYCSSANKVINPDVDYDKSHLMYGSYFELKDRK